MNINIIGLDNDVFSKDSIIETTDKFFDHVLKTGLDSIHYNFKVHSEGGKQRIELTLNAEYNGKEYHVSNLHDKESQWDINDSIKCVLQELKKILLRQKEKVISQKKERDKTEED